MWSVAYDPAVHRVHDIPFVHFLRREFKDPDLFTYRHERSGNWLVAFWNSPADRRKRFIELAVLGKDPVGSKDVVEDIRSCVRGTVECESRKRQLRQHLASDDHRHVMGLIEDQAKERELRKFLRNRLNNVRRDNPYFAMQD